LCTALLPELGLVLTDERELLLDVCGLSVDLRLPLECDVPLPALLPPDVGDLMGCFAMGLILLPQSGFRSG